MNHSRKLALGAATSFLIVIAACAGNSALEQRIAALEQRLAQSEPQDAGADVASEATPETVSTESPPDVDAAASVHFLDGGEWRARTIDLGGPPADPLSDCLEHTHRFCTSAVVRALRQSPPDAFAWSRDTQSMKAEDTAEGRSCLATEATKCRADPLRFNRGVQLKRWLDKQLTPTRLDPTASAALRARLRSRLGAPDAGDLRVDCAAEFCRVTLPDPSLRERVVQSLIDSEPGPILILAAADPIYVPRDGWRFPQPGYSPGPRY